MYFSSSLLLLCFVSLLTMTLTGCMVGPDFHKPIPPSVDRYTELPLPKKTVGAAIKGSAGKSQRYVYGKDISAEWWYLFRSPQLNNLIERGLDNSPNLAAAFAALTQARENLKAQIGASYYPNISGQFTYERQRFSGSSFGVSSPPNVFDLFFTTLNFSYTLDVFGGLRRQVEADTAQVDYEYFELEAAYLTLTSNIVTTSITIASLRAQIQATNQLVRTQERLLKLVQGQFALGGASRADVLSQQTALEQTRATLPPLQQNLTAARDSLAVLVGSFPSEADLPYFNLDELTLPTQIPVSIPSLLTCQRPDIQASEALLHQASANIGVATANMLPSFIITGAYGWQSIEFSRLFSSNSNIWNITNTIATPIFNGGSLNAKRRASIAAYQQAAAQYKQTVLQAFQNVADALQALNHDAKTLQAQRRAEIAAKEALYLTEQQYRLGGVSYPSLLIAERQYHQATINRIQAQATRYTDTAALFAALGGGWWNREPLYLILKPTMESNPLSWQYPSQVEN